MIDDDLGATLSFDLSRPGRIGTTLPDLGAVFSCDPKVSKGVH